MNVLYLIGNGFDLNIGLETRFIDFFKYYIDETTDNNTIKSFKDAIKRNIKSWANFEEKMGVYTDEIAQCETPIETLIEYSKCIFDFKKHLINYLKKEESRVKYDDTKNIAKCINDSLFKFTQFLGVDPNAIINKISKEKMVFSFINFNYTTVFDNCLKILRESDIFQYAKVVKSGFFPLTIQNDLGTVMHIHGTLESEMILGVNDLRQIKNQKFHSLNRLNTYIKPNANDELENNKNSYAMKLLNEANIYFIFGMSLGKTDRKWWIEIMKQVILSNEKEIIIYIHEKIFDFSFIENTLEKKDEYKNIFMNHLQFTELYKEENLKILRKHIHIVINEEIFKINLV